MKLYKRLTEIDRQEISKLLTLKHNITEIAKKLNFNKSTISREIKRHKPSNHEGYLPINAQKNADNLKKREYCKIGRNEELRETIVALLRKKLVLLLDQRIQS